VKPNLFIVGAPKCGTTAWWSYLKSHPQIFCSQVKEPHFFATDLPSMRWTSDVRTYERLFADATQPVRAEFSSLHLFSATAAEGIRNYNPSAKIMIFLRDQEDFLPSWHHQHLYNYTEAVEDFETAWRLSGNRTPETIAADLREPKLLDYAAMGSFKQQVDRYRAAFPLDQVRVFHYRDWTADPRATYLQIMEFLGIEDDGRTEFPKVNYAKAHKNARLGRLILHPPNFVRTIAGLLKKMTGRSTLGLAQWAARQNEVPGYRTRISNEVRDEIRAYYADENQLLGFPSPGVRPS
jgi:hypothetical protein